MNIKDKKEQEALKTITIKLIEKVVGLSSTTTKSEAKEKAKIIEKEFYNT